MSLLILLDTSIDKVFLFKNLFSKFLGVSFASNFPFEIITAREHTASTSSKICVEITIALLVDILFMRFLISCF